MMTTNEPRIEISLDQYLNMQKDIEVLLSENIKLKDEIDELTGEIHTTNDILEDVTKSTFFDRLFNWKIYLEDINSVLNK